MRITFLLTQSLEDPSGLGRYWPISKALAKLGHQVTILALHPNYGNIPNRQFEQHGVQIRYVAQMHVWKRGNLKGYYSAWILSWIILWAIIALTWQALRVPTDAIQLGKAHPINGIAGLIAHWWHRVPLYVDCDDLESVSNRFQNQWQQRIVAWWEIRLPRWATGVTVNTQFLRTYLQQHDVSASKIIYIPNGVDHERFRPPSPEIVQHLKTTHHLHGQQIVMYVGSLSLKSHPVDLLIEAFAKVQKSIDNTKLVLVGGGEDLEQLQRQVEQYGLTKVVQFLGRVSAEEVPNYIALADIMVEPIHPDLIAATRSPLKLFESLAMGIPIITGDVGERRAIVGEAGLVIPAGPVEALSTAISQLLQNPTQRAIMQEAGIRLRGLYYWTRLIQKFIRVYVLS